MRASIFCARVSSFLVLITLSAFTAPAQSTDLRNDLQQSFKKVDVVRINAGGELRPDGKTLTLQTEGRTYELFVEPNNTDATWGDPTHLAAVIDILDDLTAKVDGVKAVLIARLDSHNLDMVAQEWAAES